MKKIVSIGLLPVLILGMASTGLAWMGEQTGHGCRRAFSEHRSGVNLEGGKKAFRGHPQKTVKRLRERLDINQEQTGKIDKLKASHKKEMIPLRASIKVARIELSELLMRPETNEKELQDKLDKLSNLRTKMQKSRIRLVLESKKLLTKDQLEKFSQMTPSGFMGMGHGLDGPGPMQRGKR